ncbi:WXG100-like domain-containing protein [Sphaerisporangium fuscum]|uniref:WXG100-like domain-containing protein n=1 Tax=Sphaerisporangium fuscum TaxID=2835868 RepID=UPI001BDD2C8E|nr:hypothetical protein [Sphaerisporangium fuscum]
MSPAIPFGAFKRLANTRPVATTATLGVAAHATFVTAMLAVEWPEGDPGDSRKAAEIFDGLAKKIDEGLVAADDVARRVWLDNSGAGIEAFKAMWRGAGAGSPAPYAGATPPARPQGFSAYPTEVAAYCRRVAGACRAYADCVETVRYVLIVMAVQLWANMLMTSMYGWITGGMSKFVQDRIMKKYFQDLARIQLKIFRMSVHTIVQNAFYYTLDSVAYAGIQQGMQWGIYQASGVQKDINGTDVLSMKTNAVQFWQAFAANMAFEGMYDLSKVLRYAPRNTRWGDFLSRMSGSVAYSIVNNLEINPTGNPVPTDWETWLTKFLIHGVRSAKPSSPS